MAWETSHILYEWEVFNEIEIMGKKRSYSDGPRFLILHRLDNVAVSCPQIPTHALTTPVWYNYSNERWMLANGQELHIPHKFL